MSEPPRVILDVGPSSAASFDVLPEGTAEIIALVAFVGTIIFCAVQACLAPRKTFCAEKME